VPFPESVRDLKVSPTTTAGGEALDLVSRHFPAEVAGETEDAIAKSGVAVAATPGPTGWNRISPSSSPR